MLPNGISSALLNILSEDIEYLNPLAEGEEAPGPRSQVHRLWCSPGNKVLSVTISEHEASLVFDMAKNIFAWAPEDRARVTDILQHAWLQNTSTSSEKSPAEAPAKMMKRKHRLQTEREK